MTGAANLRLDAALFHAGLHTGHHDGKNKNGSHFQGRRFVPALGTF
jgi:hypothetical protein